MDPAPIELVCEGVYRVPNTEYSIVRTEWDGPEGGRRYLWEASRETEHGPVIENYVWPANTLREAREALAAHLANV